MKQQTIKCTYGHYGSKPPSCDEDKSDKRVAGTESHAWEVGPPRHGRVLDLLQIRLGYYIKAKRSSRTATDVC